MELWKPCWRNLSVPQWIFVILSFIVIASVLLCYFGVFTPRAAANTTKPQILRLESLPFPAAPPEKPARIAYATPGIILWEGYDKVQFFTKGNILRRVVVYIKIKNPPKRGAKLITLTFTQSNISLDEWVEWRVRYARLPD